MTLITAETLRTRRYLLGQASDEESTAIEQHFLQNDAAIDWISAAEEALIEDYLTHQLAPADHDRFERAYLTVPHRRVRVETMRRLIGRQPGATNHVPQQTWRPALQPSWRPASAGPRVLALAASLVLVSAIALWFAARNRAPQPAVAGTAAPAPVAAPAPAPSTPVFSTAFAVTLSPIAVRSASDSPAVVVPPSAAAVGIHFETEADGRRLTPQRATIRTVDGVDMWQGPADADGISVPATKLPANDYVVTLYGADRNGAEREWHQYFLRIRTR